MTFSLKSNVFKVIGSMLSGAAIHFEGKIKGRSRIFMEKSLGTVSNSITVIIQGFLFLKNFTKNLIQILEIFTIFKLDVEIMIEILSYEPPL